MRNMYECAIMLQQQDGTLIPCLWPIVVCLKVENALYNVISKASMLSIAIQS